MSRTLPDHARSATYREAEALVFDVRSALDAHGKLVLPLDQLINQQEADVVILDYSKVDTIEGHHVSVPLSRIKALEEVGCEVFAILSEAAKAYMLRIGVHRDFREIPLHAVKFAA